MESHLTRILKEGIQLQIAPPQESLWVRLEASQLQQILHSLAWHASGLMSKGTVLISLRAARLGDLEARKWNLPEGSYCELRFCELVELPQAEPHCLLINGETNPTRSIAPLIAAHNGRVRFFQDIAGCPSFCIYLPLSEAPAG